MGIRQAMSHLFNRVVSSSSASAPGVKVLQATDAATIMLSLQPATYGTTEGTDPPIGRWNFSIGEPTDFSGSGTRKDRICGFGYNYSRYVGGTPTPAENTSDASFGWTIEDFYNLNATTLRQFEYYIQCCRAGSDGTDQVRPFMIVTQFPTLASNTAPESGVFFDVEASQSFEITVTYDNAGTLTTRTSNTAGTVTVTAAHNIVTATTKNVRWQGGARTGVTIGAVSATTAGSTVAFSGGSGTNLPAQDAAIEFYDTDTITIGAGDTNNGLDSVWEYSAGAGVLFANNSRSLKQKLSSGTAKDIAYINSSNNLILGEGGIGEITAGIILRGADGLASKYSTSAAISDSDFIATPPNAAFGFTNNGGAFKFWAKFGADGWKSVAMT